MSNADQKAYGVMTERPFMGTNEPQPSKFSREFHLKDNLDLVVVPVVLGLATGLIVPFINNDFTFVSGATTGIAAGLLMATVLIVVLLIANR